MFESSNSALGLVRQASAPPRTPTERRTTIINAFRSEKYALLGRFFCLEDRRRGKAAQYCRARDVKAPYRRTARRPRATPNHVAGQNHGTRANWQDVGPSSTCPRHFRRGDPCQRGRLSRFLNRGPRRDRPCVIGQIRSIQVGGVTRNFATSPVFSGRLARSVRIAMPSISADQNASSTNRGAGPCAGDRCIGIYTSPITPHPPFGHLLPAGEKEPARSNFMEISNPNHRITPISHRAKMAEGRITSFSHREKVPEGRMRGLNEMCRYQW